MNYITNYSKEIFEKLKELSIKAKAIDIAVAFIGFTMLQTFLVDWKNTKVKLRIITTTDQFITSPAVLNEMLQNNIEVKIINNNYEQNHQGFHNKFYIFHYADKKIFFGGSSNLTAKSLKEKYELMIENPIFEKDEPPLTYFEDLWEIGTSVDKFFIEKYENKYKIHKNFIDISIDDKVEPNEMQQKALSLVKEHISKKNNKIFIHAATGTGKTFLSALIAKHFEYKKILFFVGRLLIKDSSILTFNKTFNSSFSMSVRPNSSNLLSNFGKDEKLGLFGTPISIINNLINKKVLSNCFDYIIIDEAHHVSDRSEYKKIIDYFKPKLLLGMTATPERMSDQNVNRYFGGENIYTLDISEAIILFLKMKDLLWKKIIFQNFLMNKW